MRCDAMRSDPMQPVRPLWPCGGGGGGGGHNEPAETAVKRRAGLMDLDLDCDPTGEANESFQAGLVRSFKGALARKVQWSESCLQGKRSDGLADQLAAAVAVWLGAKAKRSSSSGHSKSAGQVAPTEFAYSRTLGWRNGLIAFPQAEFTFSLAKCKSLASKSATKIISPFSNT